MEPRFLLFAAKLEIPYGDIVLPARLSAGFNVWIATVVRLTHPIERHHVSPPLDWFDVCWGQCSSNGGRRACGTCRVGGRGVQYKTGIVHHTLG